MSENATAIVIDTAGSDAAHDSYASVFERIGLSPIFLDNAQSALEIYQEGGVAVVVSELRLAGMDGLVLARKIKRHDPDAIIILTAAIDRKADLLAAMRLGVFDFFIKPFGAREFSGSLERAVALHERLLRSSPGSAPGGLMEESHLVELNEELSRKTLELAERVERLEARERLLLEKEQQLERSVEEFERLQMTSLDPQAVDPGTDESLRAREAALAEREELLAEREAFLEQSENTLFEKGQQLQELETELEHRADGLGQGPGVAQVDPEAEAQMRAREAELNKRQLALTERERLLRKNEAIIRARELYLRESENILFDREDAPSS